MSAVDAHAVHAVLHQVADEFVIGGGVGGHGHHDANFSFGRRRPEQCIGISFQNLGAFADPDRGFGRAGEQSVFSHQNV